jgi:hypothetical protein
VSTLRAYAEANPIVRAAPCSICALPREVVEQLHAEHGTVSVTQMVDWLRTLGHAGAATRNRVRGHFERGHQPPAAARGKRGR